MYPTLTTLPGLPRRPEVGSTICSSRATSTESSTTPMPSSSSYPMPNTSTMLFLVRYFITSYRKIAKYIGTTIRTGHTTPRVMSLWGINPVWRSSHDRAVKARHPKTDVQCRMELGRLQMGLSRHGSVDIYWFRGTWIRLQSHQRWLLHHPEQRIPIRNRYVEDAAIQHSGPLHYTRVCA